VVISLIACLQFNVIVLYFLNSHTLGRRACAFSVVAVLARGFQRYPWDGVQLVSSPGVIANMLISKTAFNNFNIDLFYKIKQRLLMISASN